MPEEWASLSKEGAVMLFPRRRNVCGSFAAVRRGMGKLDQNSSYLMGRRTFLPSGLFECFFPTLFSL